MRERIIAMADRHRHRPITFRPPESDREWLYAFAQSTGQGVRKVLADALAYYRAAVKVGQVEGIETITGHESGTITGAVYGSLWDGLCRGCHPDYAALCTCSGYCGSPKCARDKP